MHFAAVPGSVINGTVIEGVLIPTDIRSAAFALLGMHGRELWAVIFSRRGSLLEPRRKQQQQLQLQWNFLWCMDRRSMYIEGCVSVAKEYAK